MASKPTRTAKGWPLRPVKKYKDICRSYKLTSGPVVLRRVTAAQRSGDMVTQTIPIGWCVREHHHHQTQPPLLSLYSFIHPLSTTYIHACTHTHTHHTTPVPCAALGRRLKLSISPRSREGGGLSQWGVTNRLPFPGAGPSHSAARQQAPPPSWSSPPAAAPGTPLPACGMSCG